MTESAAHPAQPTSTPILFAGTPEIAAQALRGIIAAGYNVTAVLTRPDAPVGRKKQLTPSPVAQAAEEAGIPTIKTAKVDADITNQVQQTGARLGVVVAYGALLPQPALEALPLGWVNLHYSRLPQYRGAAPVQHAMLNGEATTAATIFQLEAGMDTGPVHASAEYTIPEATSAGTVLAELTTLGTSLLTKLLPDLLAGNSQPVGQQGTPSLAPKLTREDAYIDPSEPGEQLVNRINATIPEPGAWTLNGENRLKLGPARLYHGDLSPDATPGRVLQAISDRAPGDSLIVLTAGDARGVVLTQVQPAGKAMMNAADWFRGQQGTVTLGSAA